ncbi:hypothetical protein GW17_00058759, partial [Ensete ventricosum]
ARAQSVVLKKIQADILSSRFSIPICTARIRRYRQNRQSAVDFGHQRSIEGEIDRRQSIEGEKGKKKKRKRRKKKKKRRIIPCAVLACTPPAGCLRVVLVRTLSPPAGCPRAVVACGSPVGDFSPARGERSR